MSNTEFKKMDIMENIIEPRSEIANSTICLISKFAESLSAYIDFGVRHDA